MSLAWFVVLSSLLSIKRSLINEKEFPDAIIFRNYDGICRYLYHSATTTFIIVGCRCLAMQWR